MSEDQETPFTGSNEKEQNPCQSFRFSALALPVVLSLVCLWQYSTTLAPNYAPALDFGESSIAAGGQNLTSSVSINDEVREGASSGTTSSSAGTDAADSTTTKAAVPSSESEEDRIRRMGKVRAKDPKFADFHHFLSHIPKSGTSYAFGRINELVYNCAEYKVLEATSKDLRFRGCNEAASPTLNYPRYNRGYKGRQCTMWMSERPYSWNVIPDNTYVILRQPKAHVISQYFHCAESEDHKKQRDKMPGSMDIWLETWVMAMDNATQAKSNKRYSCYDPRNFQTRWVDFNHMNLDVSNKANKALLKDDLKQRYTVFGDNAQMQKTICLIAMRYTGWVPPNCNCTDYDESQAADTGANHRRSVRRHLVKEYNPNKFAHGVKHHGATFETSPQQDEWISKLTETDQYLYELAVEIFAEQVEEAEKEFGIKICNAFRKPSNDTEASRLR